MHMACIVCMQLCNCWTGAYIIGQGVVTYMSPVEAFATVIKIFDRQKTCLIA